MLRAIALAAAHGRVPIDRRDGVWDADQDRQPDEDRLEAHGRFSGRARFPAVPRPTDQRRGRRDGCTNRDSRIDRRSGSILRTLYPAGIRASHADERAPRHHDHNDERSPAHPLRSHYFVSPAIVWHAGHENVPLCVAGSNGFSSRSCAIIGTISSLMNFV
jgi:hypothetical protein